MTFKIRPLNEMIPIIMKAVEEDRMMDQIHRLQKQVEFERASLRSAFDELLERDNEIERLRDALYDIQDMPEEWELDEEMNLLFVIDTHVRIAKEALGMPTEAEEKE
jgi:hypothetical protein